MYGQMSSFLEGMKLWAGNELGIAFHTLSGLISVHPKDISTSEPSESENVSLFGERVFADVIKL